MNTAATAEVLVILQETLSERARPEVSAEADFAPCNLIGITL